MKKYFKIYLLQAIIVLFLVVTYVLTNSLLVVGVFSAVIIYIYIKDSLLYKSKPLIYIDKMVDINQYTDYLEHGLKPSMQKYRPLYQAYALVYQGKIDEASTAYDSFDASITVKNKELFKIKTIVEMHLYFDKGNQEQLLNLLENIHSSKAASYQLKQSIQIYLYILKQEYEPAVELLMTLIPKLRSRVQIAEMEYHLAYSFYKLNRNEDAKAIVNFMLEKDYPIIYTSMFEELKEKIK